MMKKMYNIKTPLIIAAMFLLSFAHTNKAHAQTELTVFVSAATYAGNDLNGPGGADVLCQDLADTAGLTGMFRAWTTGQFTTVEPRDRYNHGTSIPFKLLDGTTIADNWADLTDGSLDAAIDRDQNNVAVSAGERVWTNATTVGARTSSNHCTSWTTTGGIGEYGTVGEVDTDWTDDATEACITPNRLYCFQQMDETPPATYKRAFLTASTYALPAFIGQGEADAKCQAEADANNLNATFRAWMATNLANTAPANLFTQSADPYMTTTGYKIADNWADLTDGSLDYPIVFDAAGNYISGVPHVWTNVAADGSDDSSTDCDDWTNSGTIGNNGIAGHLGDDWTIEVSDTCSVANRLYCFEQDGFNGPAPSALGCADPVGKSGDIIYNGDDHVAQYCSIDGWVMMGPAGDGGAGCTDPVGAAGDMIYNDDDDVLQYCEGDAWMAVGKTGAAAPSYIYFDGLNYASYPASGWTITSITGSGTNTVTQGAKAGLESGLGADFYCDGIAVCSVGITKTYDLTSVNTIKFDHDFDEFTTGGGTLQMKVNGTTIYSGTGDVTDATANVSGYSGNQTVEILLDKTSGIDYSYIADNVRFEP